MRPPLNRFAFRTADRWVPPRDCPALRMICVDSYPGFVLGQTSNLNALAHGRSAADVLPFKVSTQSISCR